MARLRQTGVIQNHTSLADYAGSFNETIAWKKYVRWGADGPVGRGLYAIQLRHWFKAYEEHGKSRTEDFHIILSERMRNKKENQTRVVFEETLKFLKLPPAPLKRDTAHEATYTEPMKPGTRAMLEEFFAPYNQEVYDLLGEEWQGVWDPKPQQQ
uniref:Sulfotransferase domain-containing protein n=1 Tax=Cyclophora tenuis TaxID=216820 RepID=A0A7S1D5K0_CYCTE